MFPWRPCSAGFSRLGGLPSVLTSGFGSGLEPTSFGLRLAGGTGGGFVMTVAFRSDRQRFCRKEVSPAGQAKRARQRKAPARAPGPGGETILRKLPSALDRLVRVG